MKKNKKQIETELLTNSQLDIINEALDDTLNNIYEGIDASLYIGEDKRELFSAQLHDILDKVMTTANQKIVVLEMFNEVRK